MPWTDALPDAAVGASAVPFYGGDHQVERVEPELLNPATDAAKIRAIFVHPEFARRGLGSTILRFAEKAAESEGFSRFEMGSTLAGIALYRLNGYRETMRMEVPVSAGERIGVVRMIMDRCKR